MGNSKAYRSMTVAPCSLTPLSPFKNHSYSYLLPAHVTPSSSATAICFGLLHFLPPLRESEYFLLVFLYARSVPRKPWPTKVPPSAQQTGGQLSTRWTPNEEPVSTAPFRSRKPPNALSHLSPITQSNPSNRRSITTISPSFHQ